MASAWALFSRDSCSFSRGLTCTGGHAAANATVRLASATDCRVFPEKKNPSRGSSLGPNGV